MIPVVTNTIMQQSPLQPSTRTANRASLACVQCRSRHLRCNAAIPTCSRCSNDGSQCVYLKSRRGGRVRAVAPQNETRTTSPPSLSNQPVTIPPLRSTQSGGLENTPILISDQSESSNSSGSSLADDDHVVGFQINGARESLLDLYYTFFHISQPCALPIHIFKQKLNEKIPGMKVLVLVMQFIGSLYAPTISSAPLEEQVKITLGESQPYASRYEVQALILYSITVYWCGNIQRARELLDMATSQALTIGMNLRQFAIGNSEGDLVLAESWRRTWWQLYLTDAHIASSNHATTFGTSQREVPATVELPCEEAEYNSGVRPARPSQVAYGCLNVSSEYPSS